MTSTLPVRVDAMTYPLLTEDDAARIAAAISASRAETTRTVYACAWRAWERWCAGRGLDPLGGSGAKPAVVCAYLAERAADGASTATSDPPKRCTPLPAATWGCDPFAFVTGTMRSLLRNVNAGGCLRESATMDKNHSLSL